MIGGIEHATGEVVMMPKNTGPTKYEIAYVGIGFKPISLGRREKDELTRTLKCRPSNDFIDTYCTVLAQYIAHRATVTWSTPAKVKKRLEAVLTAAKGLQTSLNALGLADELLFARFVTKRLLKSEPYTGLSTLSEAISGFLPINEDALNALEAGENRGRPPAYAEQALASDLRSLLLAETGKEPTAHRGDTFSGLLHNAFTHALRMGNPCDTSRNLKPRKDVIDLLRRALQRPAYSMLQPPRNI